LCPSPGIAPRAVRFETKLLSVFQRWGFQEIVTPSFEYYDVLALGLGEEFRDRTFKLTEQATGRLLVLRSDITPQIARVAATILKDYPKPLRFCYSSNVFRYVEPQVGRHREVYQAGVELMGLELPEADVEMIAIAVECRRHEPCFHDAARRCECLRFLQRASGHDEGQARFVLDQLDQPAAERTVTAHDQDCDFLIHLRNRSASSGVDTRHVSRTPNHLRRLRAMMS